MREGGHTAAILSAAGPRRSSQIQMDENVQRLLKRASFFLTVASTLSLLYLFSTTPLSPCRRPVHRHAPGTAPARFPRSSCDASSRRSLPPDRRLLRLRSSPSWRRRAASLSSLLTALPIPARSRALCVSAAPGHVVDALHLAGFSDVTAVDLVDFPPLVSRADPHNLPFFDGAFDLAFSAGLEGALFPGRFAGEMERTVRRGGACVVAVGRRSADVEGVKALFRWSTAVGVWNWTVDGEELAVVVMRKKKDPRNNQPA